MATESTETRKKKGLKKKPAEGDSSLETKAPEVVVTQPHLLKDKHATAEVVGRVTVLAFAANQDIQLIAGKTTTVPRAAVEDLRRTGCIH